MPGFKAEFIHKFVSSGGRPHPEVCRESREPLPEYAGNRLSCRDEEGRRGSDEGVPGPSVFPSRAHPESSVNTDYIKQCLTYIKLKGDENS